MNTPNPLQELAEKLRKLRYTVPPCAAPASWATGETFKFTVYPAGSEAPLLTEQQIEILAPIVGTLLQAERAAMVKLGSDYIRGHWGDSDMVADAMLKELTVPADASALSAVVQRETEKLREHLTWAMERVGNRMDGIYRTKGETYDCHYICPGCSAESSIKEFQHRPDCKYAAALAALQ